MRELLESQDGVVARAQLLELGMQPHDVRRLLRSRTLTKVHPGVYVDHTGPLTEKQRAWAAVRYAGPGAALWGPSALPDLLRAAPRAGRPVSEESPPIHVGVPHPRQIRSLPGVVVHRVVHLDSQARWNLSPPRQRVEHAVLDVAALRRTTEVDRIAALAGAVGSGITTVERLRTALQARKRFPDRVWWGRILDDLAEGTASVLEHSYLVRVERAHALPSGRRQVRATTSSGPVHRDVEYDGGVVVELDGRAFHDTARARDRDFERDLDAAVDGLATVRLTYGQVLDRPCDTAHRIGLLLQRAGVGTGASPCGPDCTVPQTA